MQTLPPKVAATFGGMKQNKNMQCIFFFVPKDSETCKKKKKLLFFSLTQFYLGLGLENLCEPDSKTLTSDTR